MKQQLLFLSRILIITVISFSLMRGVLLLSNWSYFSSLSLNSILLAFTHGIRFDLSIMLSLLFIPFVLIILPIRFFNTQKWHKITAWLSFIILIIALMALVMDIIFFQHFQRHVGVELIQVRGDYVYILSMMKTYWLLVLAYLGFIFLLSKFWKAWVIPKCKPLPIHLAQRVVILPLFILIMILTIRGGLVTGKPLAIINAFITDSSELANLTLNGVYTGIQASRKSNNANYYPYHQYSSEEISRTMAIPKNYPFEQQYTSHKKSPNIILLQIESLNYEFIDKLNRGSTKPKYKATPYLDSLIDKSLVYDHFYAAGQHSITGLQATWVGLPALLGFPTIDNGLSTYKVTQVAKMARKKGYKTFYAQTSKRASYRVNALANNVGFEHFWGLEDIGELQLDYPVGTKPDFGYDYETLMLLQRQLKKHFSQKPQQPILMGFFSGTTHTPYIRLPKQFETHPYEADGLGGMLNSLSYTDWSIQQFIEGLSNESWFNNTIFIITADHTNPSYLSKQSEFRELFHIPLIIYSPNPSLIQAKRISQVRSQLDLMPTLVDLMGLEQPFSAVGSSLFRQKKYPVINNMGYLMGSINERGYIKTDLTKIVGSDLSNNDTSNSLKQLLMVNQRIAESLQANNWAH